MNTITEKARRILILSWFIVSFSCSKTNLETTINSASSEVLKSDDSKKYKETYRPQFHFSPEKKWMNDPNGLIYYKGIYHLFYQYYPEDIVWGPMHWGHATSPDLINWKPEKIALYPDKNGLIFSGSAVIDTQNSSGLGSIQNPPMVAIFTYHDMDGEKAGKTDYQTQGLAYSLDEGKSWKKYSQNPIIKNPGMKDFRDPKVFWNAETKLWNMALVAGDRAQFYTSKNLIQWSFESEFDSNVGAHGGVWECPDLFKLKVNGTKKEKWVLLISINPGAPNGGSGTQYFIGDFDGKRFTTNQKDIKWVDYGTDNYAGVTYNNTPNGERVFIGWMSNWSYARNTPTKNWRSAMTLPRTLALTETNGVYNLQSQVVPQLKSSEKIVFERDKVTIENDQPQTFTYALLNQSKIDFEAKNEDLKLVFTNDVKDSLVVYYDAQLKNFTLDRRNSGQVKFEKSFGEQRQNTKTPLLQSKTIQYQIFLDWSSIELFLGGGTYSFTAQIFPNQPYTKLSISSSKDQHLKEFSISKINSIW